jgi:metallophosphoesterase (TIGR00282 family)
MNILLIGDVVGNPGRSIMKKALPVVFKKYDVDYCVANVENAAGGFGVTKDVCDEILDLGVDCLTSGNHIWDKKEVFPYIADEPRLLRPLNYPAGAPGEGAAVFTTPNGERVAVINAMGRVHMPLVDDPFAAIDRALVRLRDEASIVIVDFHAEVTSEKISLAWHLDGRATLVVGTHTHVQTADERILPHGTAAITDVGMTGPHDGVIGVEKVPAISRFLNGLPSRFETATGDPRLCAVLVEADDTSGRARSILRLSLSRADVDAIDD